MARIVVIMHHSFDPADDQFVLMPALPSPENFAGSGGCGLTWPALAGISIRKPGKGRG
ncbi:MAG: hypothetical protein ACM3YM_00625 [Sphingomonadales bacterium]